MMAAGNENGETLLRGVIREGMGECVSSLLNNGTDLSLKNIDGFTVLHEAVLQAENTLYGPGIEDEASIVNLIVNHLKQYNINTNTNNPNDQNYTSESVDVINIQDNRGNTALHLAAHCEHTNIVRVLVRHGAKVELKNSLGRTALHEAIQCHNNDAGMVELLLNEIARVIKTKNNETAKDAADSSKRVDVINMQDGVDNTALHLAVMRNNKTAVRLLLSNGADVGLKNTWDKTALHYAAKFYGDHLDIVQLMLDQVARLGDGMNNAMAEETLQGSSRIIDFINIQDYQSKTALHFASKYNNKTIARVLLSYGANVGLKNHHGKTALHKAVENCRGDTDIVRLFVDQVANVANIKNKYLAEDTTASLSLVDFINIQDDQLNTTLHLASKLNIKVIVTLLLSYGIEVGLKNSRGRTALHEAVLNCGGNADIVQLMADHVASSTDIKNNAVAEDSPRPLRLIDFINVQDDERNTVLHLGSMSDYKIIVGLLLGYGAEVGLKNNRGKTALHEAVLNCGGNADVVHLLINQIEKLAKAENNAIAEDPPHSLRIVDFINIQDDAGNTALHIASSFNFKIIVNVLLGYGAEVGLKNSRGRTALHEAVKNYRDDADIAQLLLSKEAMSAGIKKDIMAEDTYSPLRSVKYIDIQDKQNNTALHLAAQRQHKNIVKVLTNYGADVSLKNSHGRTALHEEVLEYLYGRMRKNEREAWCVIVDVLANQTARVAGEEKTIPAEDATAPSSSFNVIDLQAVKNNALNIAVQFKHKNVVKVLMDHGARVGTKNTRGWTALHEAVQIAKNDASIVELLLNQKARPADNKSKTMAEDKDNSLTPVDVVNIKDDEKYTALHLAVMRRQETIVRVLLNNGAEVGLKNSCGRTALHEAVDYFGVHVHMVELLINQKARSATEEKPTDPSRSVDIINIQDHQDNTVLHLAVKRKYENIVRVLLNNGANVILKNGCGNTALHEAILNYNEDDLDMVKLLLNHLSVFVDYKNNDIAGKPANYINIQDQEGKTALYLAAQEEGLTLVETLVLYGADICLRDHDGQTALHAAMFNKNDKVVEFLLSSFANVDAFNRTVEKSTSNSSSTVDMINIKEDNGCTALHYAVRNNNNDAVKLLVSYGIDYSIKNDQGWNALRLAATAENVEIVDLLSNEVTKKNAAASRCVISIEVDVVNDQDMQGQTTLHAVCRHRWINLKSMITIVETLVENGAQLDVQDNEGKTPLHCALSSSNDNIINILLFAGAKVDIPDDGGTTFVDACYKLSKHRRFMIPSCLFKFHLANVRPDITKKFDLSQMYTIHSRYRTILREIECLRTIRLEGISVSLYTVLNPNCCHGFVINSSLKSTIFGDTFEYQFPEYHHLIRLAFNESDKIYHLSNELSEKFSITLSQVLGMNIPEEISHMILVKLRSCDLGNLKSTLEEGVRLEAGVASGSGQAQWSQPSPDEESSPKRLKVNEST